MFCRFEGAEEVIMFKKLSPAVYQIAYKHFVILIFSLTFVALTTKNKDMITVSAREFRSNQASIFDKADGGEKIIIRRGKKQAYTLVPVYDEDMDITPQLQAKIEQARQEYKEGKTVSIRTHEELDAFFDSL
jgi:hypothetical protein